MTLQKFYMSVIGILFITMESLGQPNTFELRLNRQIVAPENRFFNDLVVINQAGGWQDIYFTASYFSENYRMGVISNGEITFLGEPQLPDDGANYISMLVGDLTNDGRRDVLIETSQYKSVTIFAAPDWRIVYSRDFVLDYDDNFINGGLWRQDNQREPFFIGNRVFLDNHGNWIRGYHAGVILAGNPIDRNMREIAQICNPAAVHLLPESRDDGGTDYFIAGEGQMHYEESAEDSIIQHDSAFFYLTTSYNRSLEEPDSLIIRAFDRTTREENERYRLWPFIWSPNTSVVNFDNDGGLEWVAPWFDQSREDTFFTHIAIFDPLELQQLREIVIPSRGYRRGAHPYIVSKGALPLDIDGDGQYELISVIKGATLCIIDAVQLTVLLESALVMTECDSRYFFLGKFTDDAEGVQMALLTADNVISIYDLPAEWTIPNEVVQDFLSPPAHFRLLSAFPNPFNSSVTISFSSSLSSSLRIYDISGRLVADLTNSAFRTPHSAFGKAVWDASSVGAGVYFVKLEYGTTSQSLKVLLIK